MQRPRLRSRIQDHTLNLGPALTRSSVASKPGRNKQSHASCHGPDLADHIERASIVEHVAQAWRSRCGCIGGNPRCLVICSSIRWTLRTSIDSCRFGPVNRAKKSAWVSIFVRLSIFMRPMRQSSRAFCIGVQWHESVFCTFAVGSAFAVDENGLLFRAQIVESDLRCL
jgi:hypothetical protein